MCKNIRDVKLFNSLLTDIRNMIDQPVENFKIYSAPDQPGSGGHLVLRAVTERRSNRRLGARASCGGREVLQDRLRYT